MPESLQIAPIAHGGRWHVLAEGVTTGDAQVGVRWRYGEFQGHGPLHPPTRSAVAREWIEDLARTHDELGPWQGFDSPSSRGRPRLVDRHADASISHSGNVLLVAVAAGARIGVDVELPPFDAFGSRALARRMCTEDELLSVSQMSETHRRRALARLWTAKEALVKADGRGLVIDLRTVTPRLSAESRSRTSGRPEAHVAIVTAQGSSVIPLTLPRSSAPLDPLPAMEHRGTLQ